MNILWVEDFDEGSKDRVAMTRNWLDTILCDETKKRLTEQKQIVISAPLSFMETLAKNDSPIVWADSLASGLAAATLGTAAYRGNKYSDIPPIKAAYEVALLDLAVPYKKDGGQLSDKYSERAQAFLDAEERNRTFDLRESGLDTFPGIILAMRLMQQGMPAERIFFLTANADIPGMPVSLRCLAGPELLKNNIINKNKIGDLLRRIENNVYYQLKMLISSVSAEVLSFVEQAEFMGTTWNEFDFKKTGGFLFEEKEETVAFLKELAKMLPLHVTGDVKSIYYNTIVNKILREFDNVKAQYIYKDENKPPYYEDSIPARFYARNLKYLRNVNVHTSYLKNTKECEVGLVFLMFVGYVIEVYREKNNKTYDNMNIISKANAFFDNESILGGKKDASHAANGNFMSEIASRYIAVVRGDQNSDDETKNWFINITADIPDKLKLTAWDVLRMIFWSQVSFTDKDGSGVTCYYFDSNMRAFRTRPFFSMLGDRLALCENEIKGGVE